MIDLAKIQALYDDSVTKYIEYRAAQEAADRAKEVACELSAISQEAKGALMTVLSDGFNQDVEVLSQEPVRRSA